jgi:tight adherence protein B
VAKTIRDREALRRHVKSLTAEGRLSAIILTGLPFVIALLLYYTRPRFITLLFTEPVGRFFAIMSLGLLVVGSVWLRKITKIEV